MMLLRSLLLCLMLPAWAWAQTPAYSAAINAQPPQAQQESPQQHQIHDLESAIGRLQQEQQSAFQQFQIIQELRRDAQQANDAAIAAQYSSSTMGSIPNYDDVERVRQQRLAVVQQYTDQMNALYARYRELDARKRALLDQLDRLNQAQQAAPGR